MSFLFLLRQTQSLSHLDTWQNFISRVSEGICVRKETCQAEFGVCVIDLAASCFVLVVMQHPVRDLHSFRWYLCLPATLEDASYRGVSEAKEGACLTWQGCSGSSIAALTAAAQPCCVCGPVCFPCPSCSMDSSSRERCRSCSPVCAGLMPSVPQEGNPCLHHSHGKQLKCSIFQFQTLR